MTDASNRRVALVTGASRGIGKCGALALARRGFDVAITARTIKEGDGRAQPSSLEGRRHRGRHCRQPRDHCRRDRSPGPVVPHDPDGPHGAPVDPSSGRPGARSVGSGRRPVQQRHLPGSGHHGSDPRPAASNWPSAVWSVTTSIRCCSSSSSCPKCSSGAKAGWSTCSPKQHSPRRRLPLALEGGVWPTPPPRRHSTG